MAGSRFVGPRTLLRFQVSLSVSWGLLRMQIGHPRQQLGSGTVLAVTRKLRGSWIKNKERPNPGWLAHTCNPSIYEAEAGGSIINSRPA